MQVWIKKIRQWLWQRQAQHIVRSHQEDLLKAYRSFATPRPYPTTADWARFRQERDAAFTEAERNPNGFNRYPVLGSAHYHWAGFGEDPTAIDCSWWDEGLWIALKDGRRLFIPSDVVPILRDALPEERRKMVIWHSNETGHEQVEFPLLNTEVLLISVLAFRLGVHDTSTFIHHVSASDPMTQIVDLIDDVMAGDRTRADDILREISQRVARR